MTPETKEHVEDGVGIVVYIAAGLIGCGLAYVVHVVFGVGV